MKKWLLVGAVMAAVALPFSPARAESPKSKLNVLLIISDDLCNDLGCYGAPVKTPNIDRLAERGVKLDRIYCQFPLCGPSRCSFMSGLRPDTEGVLGNGQTVRFKLKNLVTLPELFRHNGYYSARVGKVYHLGIPGQVGTPGPDDPQSWDYAFNPKGNEFPTKDDGDEFDPDPKNGQSFRRNLLKGDGHEQADFQSADEAIRLLNQHKDQPFFLAVGFIRPHVPEVAPKSFFDLYDVNQIKLPEIPANDFASKPPLAFHAPADMGMSESDRRESIRAYHATTSFMDAQAGRVLDELHRLNLDEKTVIVFMSDHGYLLGQHHAWQKTMLFEETCRVPMIYVTPDMKTRGQSARGIAESVDMYPTVAELCGLTAPKELQGKSLVPLLEDPSKPFKSAAFTQLHRNKNGDGRSIRSDRFRYTEWNAGKDGMELYDHNSDPAEYHNLAKDPAYADTLSDLQKQLHAHYNHHE